MGKLNIILHLFKLILKYSVAGNHPDAAIRKTIICLIEAAEQL